MTLSGLRQHPAFAFHGIISVALLLVLFGCGGSSAFDPASSKKSARFLSKSKPFLDFEAGCKAKNPVQLQKASDEFATSMDALIGKEVRWTVTIQKILEGGLVTVGSNQFDVFVGGHLTSEGSPDWKSKVAGLVVGQSVEVTAKIESVKLWTSFDDMLESHVKEGGSSRDFAKFMSAVAYEFAIGSGLDEKRATPFIAVKISDAKLN